MTDVPRTVRLGTAAGATVGILGFFGAGLIPAFHFGKQAGALLAGGIFHEFTDPPLAYTLLVYFGALMVMIGIGSLFTVMGAVAGTAVGQILHHLAGPAPKPAVAEHPAGTEETE
jgi:hypothetical protein